MIAPLVSFSAESLETRPVDYEVSSEFGSASVNVIPVSDRAKAFAGFEGVRPSGLEALARLLHDRGFRVAGFYF